MKKIISYENREINRKYCREYRQRNPEYFKRKDAKKIERESDGAKIRRIARTIELPFTTTPDEARGLAKWYFGIEREVNDGNDNERH